MSFIGDSPIEHLYVLIVAFFRVTGLFDGLIWGKHVLELKKGV